MPKDPGVPLRFTPGFMLPPRFAGCTLYFFINSSTAVVIALIPVRRVGSGNGSNKLE
jgi:hypothetical protein